MCGPKWTNVILKFDSGTVLPVTGETLTGETSAATGTVASVELVSGAWASGTAAGYVTMTTASPVDDGGFVFSNNELMDGSTGGIDILTADGQGYQVTYGILYPQCDMVKADDGSWYCIWHYRMNFDPQWRDEVVFDTSAEDEGRNQP